MDIQDDNYFTTMLRSAVNFFFYFRARIWAIASGREDLITKENLHTLSYKICGRHFENKMFLNDLHNRLQKNAVPTLFAEGTSSDSTRKICQDLDEAFPHSSDVTSVITFSPTLEDTSSHSTKELCQDETLPQSSDVASVGTLFCALESTSSHSTKELCQDLVKTFPHSSDVASVSRSCLVTAQSHQTQTDLSLSSSTPRKNRLKRKLRHLENTMPEQHMQDASSSIELKYSDIVKEEMLSDETDSQQVDEVQENNIQDQEKHPEYETITKKRSVSLIEEDECDLIGKCVAAKLRRLDPIDALIAEKRINDILFDFQLKSLSRSGSQLRIPDDL
ncbi:uncharacterized protein LOC126743057 isoform X2 [Anthonomus grandis grandis]|uniref:uncharacterized protein LOC126743057 isoform X2 n=1 Tax=Anthonomus grandis grandis TaxID=2921223 RepID=UPI0021663843|nr:uncharacterized protein LOC126743057 isoform X2 [Anthonomus grandis grandis]